ncbi:MAG: hypothetical protein ACK5KU_11560 [Beutenbergiaceae bacterium]
MNRILTAVLASIVTRDVGTSLAEHPPGGARRWRRRNFRGREVSLLGGIAAATGALTGAVATGGPAGLGATVVVASGGLLGAIDDADTTATSKGLRGHLRALRRGEITTGLLKLVGISAAAVTAAAVSTQGGRRGGRHGATPNFPTRVIDVLGSGMLIAGTANLVNLFDLRPGRALKVVGLVCAPLSLARGASGRLATAGLATVACSWRGDVDEETMLGDAGANALGALAGMSLAQLRSPRMRALATCAVVGLVFASERVSFSRVIDSTPGLRELDAWGRAPE